MKFFSLLLLALSTANLPAADWNQFRGSAGDGQSTVKGIPTTWSKWNSCT